MHEQKFSFNNKLISKLFLVTGAISKLNSFFGDYNSAEQKKKGKEYIFCMPPKIHTTDGFNYNAAFLFK